MQNARYWLLTIPHNDWQQPTELPDGVVYLRGQQEHGGTTNYQHWQLVAVFRRPQRLAAVKTAFTNTTHAEPTTSPAAYAYVWKDDTAVAGTRFELGRRPFRRNNATDWAAVRDAAIRGDLRTIPDDIYIRHYHNLRRITSDHAKPTPMERSVSVWWGPTGTGKSHAAWTAAGMDSYAKDPRTKFWDGYRGDINVVIDEFRGGIDISHILRWFDKYPVRVEIKGSSLPLNANHFFVTSNIHPKDWYPDLDSDTLEALLRRLTIFHFTTPFSTTE